MKQEMFKKIEERASKKERDGVYSCEGYPYAVINKRLKLVGDFDQVLQISHGFAVIIAKCDHYKVASTLRKIFKENQNKL